MDLVLLGLVIGIANGLLAVGLVLVHMANRTVNLAHGELGAFTVAMMLALTRNAHLNYWLALGLSMVATATLAVVIERGILRRLFSSPRLIVLIATIGVAQLVIVLRLLLPKPTVDGDRILFGGSDIFPVPLHWQPVEFGRIVLLPAHFLVLLVGPIAAAAVFAFLRFTAYGTALRAAAENATRARLLGIPVRRVSTIAWIVAALLSGLGAVLLAPIIGFSATEAVGLPILLRGLAAATVARMENVGTAFGMGLVLGVADQLVLFWTGRSGLTDLVLFGVILLALLSQRQGYRRSAESSWEVAEPLRPLPAAVLAHPRWVTISFGAKVAGAIGVVLVPIVLRSSTTFFFATVCCAAIIAVSMTVLTGWAGQMSLGQWAIAGVGGVFGSKLVTTFGVPFWLALVLAAVVGAVITFLLGLPALRLEGSALAVVTLGFAVMSATWLYAQPWFRGEGGFPRPSYLSPTGYYAVCVVALGLAVGATRALQRSRHWRMLVAVRDNPSQAAALGVDVVRAKLTAFVISGVMASAAGFLFGAGVGIADSNVFPPVRSLAIVAAVVIGGLGSVTGAVLGALWLFGIPYFAGSVSPYIGLLSTGTGLLVLVLFLPGGLARLGVAGRDLLARWATGVDPRPRVVPVSTTAADPPAAVAAPPPLAMERA